MLNHVIRVYRVFQLKKAVSFSILAACLELSHKYDIEHIRTEALDRMRTCFCHDFDTMNSSAQFNEVGHWKTVLLSSSSLQLTVATDAIRAVNLIRLVDEPTMLPVAFYLCSLLPIPIILSGTMLPNGRTAMLSPDDLVRCIEGRTNLVLRACKQSERLFIPIPSDQCSTRRQCIAFLQSKSSGHQKERDYRMDVHCVTFYGMGRAIPRSSEFSALCEVCFRGFLSRHVEEMRYIWENLPGDLGLKVSEWDAAPSQS